MSKTRINTTIDSEVWKEIKKIAIDNGTNVNEILERLLREYIQKTKGVDSNDKCN